jgi:hypothetical protein
MNPQPGDILTQRLERRPPGWLDIHTTLHHFALINYAVPKERLQPHIPNGRFHIPEFDINDRKYALLSVVPFVDTDFRYIRLAPWLKFRFAQTNYRVYVVDRQTEQHVAWFFGTTLGSNLVHLARTLWRIPWYYGRYTVNCHREGDRYRQFSYQTQSTWASAEITLTDTGQSLDLRSGFDNLPEMQLILTHPITGFYYRLDGRLGTYTIWHPLIEMTLAQPKHLHFQLLQNLNILTPEEMQQPHSIFLCPQVPFDIHLPPRKVVEYQAPQAIPANNS